ncbi:MAG: hypothetical protein IPL28_17220 [Chloroflexi bacterium]|nr:hypothetical protein [Chloroflexota bacterium]
MAGTDGAGQYAHGWLWLTTADGLPGKRHYPPAPRRRRGWLARPLVCGGKGRSTKDER